MEIGVSQTSVALALAWGSFHPRRIADRATVSTGGDTADSQLEA